MHGKFINNVLEGSNIFDNYVDSDLLNNEHKVLNRQGGKLKKYPIGTTIHVCHNNEDYLLFALSKTNKKFEAYTNLPIICKALDGLFEKAREECNGKSISLPLIGTGLSRSGITPNNIIDLILISILLKTKEREITNNINIVIEESRIGEINLFDIKRKWE